MIAGILSGVIIAFAIKFYIPTSGDVTNGLVSLVNDDKPIVMGFLPYWQIQSKDYSKYVNRIAYFGLTIDSQGKIVKYTDPDETESEPGWLKLQSEKTKQMLSDAKKSGMKTSLVVFSADEESIGLLISDPVLNAKTMVSEIAPILKKYNFDDLNLDIESFAIASDEARLNFTKFVKTTHSELGTRNSELTLSIDVSPTALIKPFMIDIPSIAPFVEKVIFMTYDFHYQNSYVSGSVSPLGGVPATEEYDVETSIKNALAALPPEKIVMGAPLYGYEWETLENHRSAAIIPGTGLTASNQKVEEFLSGCATCEAVFDEVTKESYLIYKDEEVDTYHQIFYPDKKSMEAKIQLMEIYKIGGIALWALGYEGKDILEPLKAVK